MSKKGVLGAAVLFASFLAYLAGAVAFDAWLHRLGGDDATITFGVRWLLAHAAWTVVGAVFFAGVVVGFLWCHLFGSPKLFQDGWEDDDRKDAGGK